MRTIPAPSTKTGRGPQREDWLEAKTLTDSQGREYSVRDLLDQCRRDYGSVCLKKTSNGKLGYKKRSPSEILKISQMAISDIAIQYQISREQASLLKYRCLGKVRLGIF